MTNRMPLHALHPSLHLTPGFLAALAALAAALILMAPAAL